MRIHKNIKVVVFDFDGVLTDNKVYISGNGDEFVCQDNNDSRNHDNNNQVTNYSNTLSCRSCNILLIGLFFLLIQIKIFVSC